MIKHITKLSVVAATGLALSASAFADVKVNENISVNGYAVGSYTYTKPDGGASSNTFLDSGSNNVDSVKLGVLGKYDAFSSYVSVLHVPGASNEAGLLDAYATYDMGDGLKVTGGKFLSYLGYEAFNAADMTQISYSLVTVNGIPAFHTGAKVDYTGKGFTLGVAAVDSVFPGTKGFIEGDREFEDTIGYELVGTYTGIDKLTIFAGFATEGREGGKKDVSVINVWASYALSSTVSLAAEVCDNAYNSDSWMVFASYKSSDAISTIFRVSGVNKYAGNKDDMQYTVAPTYTINANLSVRGEITFQDGDSGQGMQYGIQGVFKF